MVRSCVTVTHARKFFSTAPNVWESYDELIHDQKSFSGSEMVPNIARCFAGPMQASRHTAGVLHHPNAAFPCTTRRGVSSNT
jgi:hypothetical protein